MKEGKWNYTEDIKYRVVMIKLLAVEQQKMHWQNAFANEGRQVVEVVTETGYKFYIDNADGTGLLKISRGGGPDSYSAHISEFEFIKELPEHEWQQFDQVKFDQYRTHTSEWQKNNFPEDYKKLESLRKTAMLISSGNFHVDSNGTIQEGKRK